MPVELTLTPSSATGIRGQTLSFTAGMDSTIIHGYTVDFRGLKWKFITDGSLANDSTPCVEASGATCTLRVRSSGTISATAYVNGQQKTKSAHIEVPCSTSIPELDDAGIRAALKDLVDKANIHYEAGEGIPVGGSVGFRRETAGDIYRRPDGTMYFIRDTLMVATECGASRVKTEPYNTLDVKIGDVHVHPVGGGMIAYGCGSYLGHLYRRGPWDTTSGREIQHAALNQGAIGGGSLSDWAYWSAQTQKVDAYVMTEYQIFRIKKEKMDTSFHGDRKTPEKYIWHVNPNGCSW
ncbi:MAG: hypothetical protein JWM95_1294 [Gemmatimonadetes bacterium]|nr:hypothetical protein [Gemmatimonadota bacterium]